MRYPAVIIIWLCLGQPYSIIINNNNLIKLIINIMYQISVRYFQVKLLLLDEAANLYNFGNGCFKYLLYLFLFLSYYFESRGCHFFYFPCWEI